MDRISRQAASPRDTSCFSPSQTDLRWPGTFFACWPIRYRSCLRPTLRMFRSNTVSWSLNMAWRADAQPLACGFVRRLWSGYVTAVQQGVARVEERTRPHQFRAGHLSFSERCDDDPAGVIILTASCPLFLAGLNSAGNRLDRQLRRQILVVLADSQTLRSSGEVLDERDCGLSQWRRTK